MWRKIYRGGLGKWRSVLSVGGNLTRPSARQAGEKNLVVALPLLPCGIKGESKMTFPNPCCRCGFCCLHETCPVGQAVLKIGKADPCPALQFKDGLAVCLLALENPEIIGVGAGCCIKATAWTGAWGFDFASLPPATKFQIVSRMA
jgi:hypothetical protein